MSASGFTPIQLYRSATPGATPSAGNLTDGELAVNTADEKLFFKNSSGSVVSMAVSAAGTVTSVAASGGTTGLTFSGSPITTSGTLTLSGTLAVANGGTGATTAGTARTNLGATTVGGNMFTLTNPSAITFPRFNADNTVSALDAATFRTAIGVGTGAGTVTSVALSGGTTGLTVSGSPITTSGTITLAGTLAVANGGTGTTTSTGTGSTVRSDAPVFTGLVQFRASSLAFNFGSDGVTGLRGGAGQIDIMCGAAPSAFITEPRFKMNTVFSLETGGAPASASATGTTGDISFDSSYIYVCVATNTWKRTAISTWP
jgi:hypothetical protein